MSRMIAVIDGSTRSLAQKVGPNRLDSFARLAALHSDGWGVGALDASGIPSRTASSAPLGSAEELSAAAGAVRIAAAYVRFASAGSAIAPENVQPFARNGLCFCHNGALVPSSRAHDLLTVSERMQLSGDTDSEVYFQLILRHRRADPDAAQLLDAVTAAAIELRSLFPDACLNAFVLSASGLVVVQSAGTRPVPHAAFEARGYPASALPSGHHDGYNQLWTLRDGDTRLVATTGIDLTGWEPLPPDTVTWFGVASHERRVREL